MGHSVKFLKGKKPGSINTFAVGKSNRQLYKDNGADTIVGPEEKAAATRGQKYTGTHPTLQQTRLLVSRGFNGEIIRLWTEYHAQKVIDEDKSPGQEHLIRNLEEQRRKAKAQKASNNKVSKNAGSAKRVINTAPKASTKSKVQCPACRQMVPKDQLKKHRFTNCPRTEVRVQDGAVLLVTLPKSKKSKKTHKNQSKVHVQSTKPDEDIQWVVCPHCGAQMKSKARLKSHIKRRCPNLKGHS
jgi:hypothetical protein